MTIAALIWYVLSIGPVNWLRNLHFFNPLVYDALHHFYKPLWEFAIHVPTLLRFLIWWVELWSINRWNGVS